MCCLNIVVEMRRRLRLNMSQALTAPQLKNLDKRPMVAMRIFGEQQPIRRKAR